MTEIRKIYDNSTKLQKFHSQQSIKILENSAVDYSIMHSKLNMIFLENQLPVSKKLGEVN